jgi:hypothetical protein
MNILISITSYHESKKSYLTKVLANYLHEYEDHTITFVLSTNYEFEYPNRNIVCLPKIYDGWEFTWNNKKYVLENYEKYDYIIESDDDVFIPKRTFDYYVNTQKYLDGIDNQTKYLCGFNVCEEKNGILYVINAGLAHDTVKQIHQIGEKTFIELTNRHSASYLIDKANMSKALQIGIPSTPCSDGIYGTPDWSISSIYKNFIKVMPIDEINKNAMALHLPNKYINQDSGWKFPTIDELADIDFCKMHMK